MTNVRLTARVATETETVKVGTTSLVAALRVVAEGEVAPSRVGNRIVLLIDRSASTMGAPLAAAKRAAHELICRYKSSRLRTMRSAMMIRRWSRMSASLRPHHGHDACEEGLAPVPRRLPKSHHRSYDVLVARTDTLIQTLVSPELAAWVRARAAVDGLQVSGWIRQLIHREQMRLVVDASWSTVSRTRRANTARPTFKMERLGFVNGDHVEFRWLDESSTPIRDRDVEKKFGVPRAQLDTGHFVLRGDPIAWRVVHAFADADDDGAMRLVLARETRRTRGAR